MKAANDAAQPRYSGWQMQTSPWRTVVAACVALILAAPVEPQEIPYNQLSRQSPWPYKVEMPPTLRRQSLEFPAAGRWKVLKADLHIHTIYSDGQVTPDVRVLEAWRDGIDVLGISD